MAKQPRPRLTPTHCVSDKFSLKIRRPAKATTKTLQTLNKIIALDNVSYLNDNAQKIVPIP